MPAGTRNIVVIGLPKSGNMYFTGAIQKTLGCVPVAFCTRANIHQQIMPEKLDEFMRLEWAIGGQHLPPTQYNLRLLEAVGIEKIAILFRDPRDAVISWWRHLERSDIKGAAWSRAVLFAAGLQSRDYYDLSSQEKLRDLIEFMFPSMQQWMKDWIGVMSSPSPFQFHLMLYERFALAPRDTIRDLLRFFGHDTTPVLPETTGKTDAGIHLETHFRRGRAGSYRDEAPPHLISMLDERLDWGLAAKFGWP